MRPVADSGRRAGFAGQEGFALLEVLISAVLVALIVTATFTGFDASNRATADERAHAQADVLAQQDEDRLRSMQIDQLSGLSETRTITYNGTTYTVKSTGEFLSDATESESCVKESGSASYVRTTSKVTWSALGTRPAVVETGLITPSPGGALLVQVFNAKGNGVAGMAVEAKGPSPSTSAVTATTGANGCVIFASLTEGEYSVTTHQTGYVDKDGNSEPPTSQRTASITSGTTTKKSFEFDRAGTLKVNFVTGASTPAASTGDTFVIYNTGMTLPHTRQFGTLDTNVASITTPTTIFPFGEPRVAPAEPISPYVVYAGTCTADLPSANGQAESANPKVNAISGETISVNVVVPPVNIKVMSGSSSGSPGSAVTGFSGYLKDEGAECGGAKRTFNVSSSASGELSKPMPFGTFSLCVSATAKISSKYRRVPSVAIANNNANGTALQTIYMTSASSESSNSELKC